MSFQQSQITEIQKPSVSVINAGPVLNDFNPLKETVKPKVACYCRVSSEEELRLGSLENQIIHYTNYIRSKPEWIYAGVYSDKGKSGTDMTKRIGFNRMIRKAMNGEIDIIICKSISRFARNVVDTLDIVRQLTEKDIQVIFEKERLNTKNVSSSLLIKILATFAEEESRSTSENIEWALRKRFERGEVMAGQLFGYQITKDKEWAIVESEARIVREAYSLFLKGSNMAEIARHFIRSGYKKRSGEIDWDSANIRSILTNERYTGDALSRKTCTLDFRTHKTVINKGHKPQYYVEDHHEGIVSKEEFQKVQEKIAADNNKATPKGAYEKTPFSSRIICSSCGKNYHRFGNKAKVVRWRCASNSKSHLLCKAKPIEEAKIEALLVEGFEKRYDTEKRINDGLLIKQLIKELSSAEAVREREQNLLRVELEKRLIAENKAVLSNQDTDKVKAKRMEVEEKIAVKTKLWEDFDKDHHFREASLKRLKALKGSDKAINQILDISFIRAWVIHIKVESPFLFTIKWLDGEETVVGQLKGGLYDGAK
ncbi:DNA invertase Pin-like site-specific DNA recombinase [Desulfitispora alkaliphila]|uniref:recombinase family protein n=1 Tax=Desulfitispora alkaliphila TaxID=622674 RepID=UPI003D20A744